MVLVPLNLVALVAFAAYVTAAVCWQQTHPAPAQAIQSATTPAQGAMTTPTSRLFTNR